MDVSKLGREELLNRLHSLPFCMRLTILPSEGCVEVNTVSSKGIASSWESIEDFVFNAYCLKGLSKNKIITIKAHIASKAFYIDDLSWTQLKKIIPAKYKDKELSDLFVNFLELPDESLKTIYCYSDVNTDVIYVSRTPDGLSDVLNLLYPIETFWEEFSDGQLKIYLSEYQENGCEIPFCHFD